MTRRPAAPNAVPLVVTDYGPDPRGHALFYGLTAAAGSYLNRARAVVAAPQWLGWSGTQQRMTGAAGAGTVLAPRNSELTRETTTLDSPTQAIFRSRMGRGQN